MDAMPAFCRPSMPLRVSLRPFLTRTSPPDDAVTSAAALRPASVPLTAHASVDPVTTIRSTL